MNWTLIVITIVISGTVALSVDNICSAIVKKELIKHHKEDNEC